MSSGNSSLALLAGFLLPQWCCVYSFERALQGQVWNMHVDACIQAIIAQQRTCKIKSCWCMDPADVLRSDSFDTSCWHLKTSKQFLQTDEKGNIVITAI